MRFSAIVAALAGSAAAFPAMQVEKRGDWCISPAKAQKAAEVFLELLSDYTVELALATLTVDFEDWSSSVNEIINLVAPAGTPKLDLLGPTFPSRAAFIASQGTQPSFPSELLGVVNGCDSVSLRWYTSDSARGQPTKADNLPVVGNVIMHVVEGGKYGFKIKAIYSEFDSAAWLINLGVVSPDATLPASKRSLITIDAATARGNMI